MAIKGTVLMEIRRAERGRAGTVAWYFGINLMNLDNIVIEKVVVVRTSAYHIRLSNVGNVAVSGCVMKSRGSEHGRTPFRRAGERHYDFKLRLHDR